MTDASISERYFSERDALREAYDLWKPRLTEAAAIVDLAVAVSGRVKSHRSVIGKAYRRPGQPRSWESFGDLVAFKVVFPTDRGVGEFSAWLEAQAEWSPVLDSKKSPPDALRYRSMQFDLASPNVVDTQGKPVKVEVQVRTAVADAWYVVDHRLRYKGMVELPEALKRKLYRLIVLTELFDEEVEAVLTQQAQLPEYAVARLYEQLVRAADSFLDGYSKSTRPEGLLELLLTAYSAAEIEGIEEALKAFMAEHHDRLERVFKDHLHDAANFVELRDWLYYEPEALLVAERALNKPAMVRAAAAASDFESVLAPMIDEFSSRLP